MSHKGFHDPGLWHALSADETDHLTFEGINIIKSFRHLVRHLIWNSSTISVQVSASNFISNFNNVVTLDLTHNIHVQDGSFLKCMKFLTSVSLQGCENIPSEDLVINIPELQFLHFLDISECYQLGKADIYLIVANTSSLKECNVCDCVSFEHDEITEIVTCSTVEQIEFCPVLSFGNTAIWIHIYVQIEQSLQNLCSFYGNLDFIASSNSKLKLTVKPWIKRKLCWFWPRSWKMK